MNYFTPIAASFSGQYSSSHSVTNPTTAPVTVCHMCRGSQMCSMYFSLVMLRAPWKMPPSDFLVLLTIDDYAWISELIERERLVGV